ncbi:hypothetical protein AJ78_02852 [Emergomyces pasteurianus Ep9510]|uniref:Calcineurin-like phosphoesterase domain-containing protein n=1 Tax=Emergomyces pasteurianus Ep9510 TaxID=1447872 RepID=A0A1J9PKI3_9EURO|nr:hypothetical protein AJ78_02852 [Emergomyces pasteurianus Ep9510]
MVIEGRPFSMIALLDTFYQPDPLRNNIVQTQAFHREKIRFSRQLDFSSIPVPRLATLLQGAARRFLESKEYAAVVVDGMNLEDTWCIDRLDTRKHGMIECVLHRIASKRSRISGFQPGNITCFVETEEEARTLRMIPGYNEISWSREQQSKPKEIDRVDINRRAAFLGCSLWSHLPKDFQPRFRMNVPDFSIIKDWSVEAHDTEHNRDAQSLQQEMNNISLEEENCIVIFVTHHAPSFMNTTDPRHKSQPRRSAFRSDLLEPQVKSWQGSNTIRCWILGHTYWNTAFGYRGTISSNQAKYDSRRFQKPGFFSF